MENVHPGWVRQAVRTTSYSVSDPRNGDRVRVVSDRKTVAAIPSVKTEVRSSQRSAHYELFGRHKARRAPPASEGVRQRAEMIHIQIDEVDGLGWEVVDDSAVVEVDHHPAESTQLCMDFVDQIQSFQNLVYGHRSKSVVR